jgi:hypothetical protein
VKQLPFLLRIAAIGSSVLLAAGFVAYRAGTFGWFNNASAEPVEAGSKPADSGGQPPTAEPLFYGSKSGIISDPALVTDGPLANKQAPAPKMSGTKSFAPAIIIGGPPTQDAKPPAQTQAPAAPAKQPMPTIMLGPKSGPVFFPQDAPPTQKPPAPAPSPTPDTKQQPPTIMGGSKSFILPTPPINPEKKPLP